METLTEMNDTLPDPNQVTTPEPETPTEIQTSEKTENEPDTHVDVPKEMQFVDDETKYHTDKAPPNIPLSYHQTVMFF